MSALVPAAIPICRLPIVELAAPDTPSTAGFGEFVLIVTVPVPLGAVPVDQLLPTVQSVLVVPFHTCALADADQPHMTIAPALTPASSARDRRFSPLLLPRPAVSSEAMTQVPSALDQMMRNT
ncbi:hypothetical protein R77591_03164 [Ralstonia mannitolilytica]|uniref:Uncharacterized protein n=1 Tax=Ralstonia mannitolilytica TaxID=105219 RepID=A0AAD2ELY2_9RALS|nr:hypothetical protein [Ralstonia mannitolilytica]CAJ0687924.1 hypothetical protein R77591_03164 [Ralstonia mannitolilytica]CAJ0890242.1 hypothetical protein R77569_04043 [Ralstonia mannitolilytica]